jgi:AraC-like DNA-binding protein
MSIASAVKDLRDTIIAEGFQPDDIQDIAEDWGVHPALLSRKFEEQYNAAPADYKVPMSPDQLREMAIAVAKKKAEEVLKGFTGSGGVALGQLFTVRGEEYVTVGLLKYSRTGRGNPKLAVIRVRDAHMKEAYRVFNEGVYVARKYGLMS